MFSTESQSFADDIAFYSANPTLSNIVSTLNIDLDKLDQTLSRKELLLNHYHLSGSDNIIIVEVTEGPLSSM